MRNRRPAPITITPNDNIAMVIKDIYIGASQAADNEDGLREIGITHIINLGNTNKEYQKAFKVLRVIMDDDPEADLLSILPITNVFIECASRVGKVFVHCRGGISRSPAVIVGYLIKKYQMSYDEALKTVRKVRDIRINDGFAKQLHCYAEADANIFLAEEEYRKDCYSMFIKTYHENSIIDEPKEVRIQSIVYYPSKEEGITISLTDSFNDCFYCKCCNQRLVTRNQFFVHGWDHKNNADLHKDIVSILDQNHNSVNQESVDITIQIDNSSHNTAFSFYNCIISFLEDRISLDLNTRQKLYNSILSFCECCLKWRDFRGINEDCSCCCVCTQWIHKQIEVNKSELTCPNEQCKKIVGEFCVSPTTCSCGKSLIGKVALHWDSMRLKYRVFYKQSIPPFSSSFLPPQ